MTLNRPSNRLDNIQPPLVCYRCGANAHVASECRFKKEVCHKCGKRGHIQRVCRAPQTHGPVDPHPDQDTRNLPMPSRRNQMSMETF